MKILTTKRFKRAYKKLDPQSHRIIIRALEKLVIDFSNPSLRVSKMEGRENVWEASANMDLSITIILRNCGHHDRTLRNP